MKVTNWSQPQHKTYLQNQQYYKYTNIIYKVTNIYKYTSIIYTLNNITNVQE